MGVYYNENDPKAAAWLNELFKAGALPAGDVDERDIRDVRPDELMGYTQCHFFAGIGGWTHALRLAEWSDDRPVWTGSCPCQPYSAAGTRKGFADERHLWPHWFHLIDQCRPATLFGEQVASKAALPWFDLVSADMEAAGYTIGAGDLCAAGVGAPHIRQRLWFRAERLANADNTRPQGWVTLLECADQRAPGANGLADRLANADSEQWRLSDRQGRQQMPEAGRCGEDRGAVTDYSVWGDADWLGCTDGKLRPVEPGTFPLADGIPGRVGLLRGYGNAIVPQVAQAFIEASEAALADLQVAV